MEVRVTSEKVNNMNGDKNLQYSIKAYALGKKTKGVRLAWTLDKQSEPLMTFTTVEGETEACVEVNVGWHGLYLWVQTV